ncbi:PAS domain S-box protein, partial [Acidihalobacter prosperus]
MTTNKYESGPKPAVDSGRAERRILLLGAVILTLFILFTGIGVFGIMLRQVDKFLSNGLASSLNDRVHLFGQVITAAVDRVDVIDTRPVIIRAVLLADRDPHNLSAIGTLNTAMWSFLNTGFISLTVMNKNKDILDSAGISPVNPKVTIPLKSYRNAQLAWSGSYYLRITRPIKRQGKAVGYLSAEMKLPKLDWVLSDFNSLGPSAESVICTSAASNLKCFPSRLHPAPALQQPKIVHGHLLPMARALEGKSGLANTRDYRNHKVVAAYKPIAGTGLGMVLKVDASDLYSVIWRALPYIIPTLFTMVIIGTLLLYWLIAPLIRHVLLSEVKTRENQRLLKDKDARLRILFNSVDEGIVVIDTAGSIEEFNPGAEKIFGYTKSEVLGKNVSLLMGNPDKSRHDGYITNYLNTGKPKLLGQEREFVGINKSGDQVTLDIRINEVNLGTDRIFVATMRDVTERKKNEENIRYLATHDTLTGLFNRGFFLDQVKQALRRAKRENYKVAILFMDLDHFK